MSKKRIRNCIRKLRFENNEMTQQELADRAGVTRQTIAAMEKDLYSPSLELAFRIAEVFEKPIGDVFSYEEERNE